ncbi:MAG: hypothetical protein Q9219_003868 [cf. Caloplaca sp. 3 TL-2023]
MTKDSGPPVDFSALQESLTSAIACVPTVDSLSPPTDGLSLLDTKNELLLSYLQNLLFLILLKLRNSGTTLEAPSETTEPSFDDIVKSLVSLRFYLEKGVRPLESRLKYQLDKLLLAASEDAASQPPSKPVDRRKKSRNPSSSASGASAPESNNGESEIPNTNFSDLSHRPNLSSFARPRQHSPQSSSRGDPNVYRPPRITPTALPTTDRTAHASARKRKNAMLDTFIREELSSAPVAEPSIGADNGLRGRDAQRERERKEYEELRLVRLPAEGGKKKGKRERERIAGGFEEVLGGAGEGLGEAVKGGGGKRRKLVGKSGGGDGRGTRVGEAWERRKSMGVRGLGGKRR